MQLLTLLQQDGVNIPADVLSAGRLTRYAVITHYPSSTESVDEDDYLQAIAWAEGALRWAESIIEGTEKAE